MIGATVRPLAESSFTNCGPHMMTTITPSGMLSRLIRLNTAPFLKPLMTSKTTVTRNSLSIQLKEVGIGMFPPGISQNLFDEPIIYHTCTLRNSNLQRYTVHLANSFHRLIQCQHLL